MLYYDQVPLTNMFNTVSGTENASRRLYLEDAYCEYTFTNASNTVAYVTLYDLWFKREMDTTDSPKFLPEGAWNAGEIQEGNSIGLQMVGSYPTRVSLFNEYYKIAQKKVHLMMPGEVHKHRVSVRPHKFITNNRVNDSIRYAGLSAATMFSAVGTPVDNAGTTTAFYDPSGALIHGGYDASGNILSSNLLVGAVTTSPVAINIVWQGRYTFRWIDDMDSDINISNTLTTGNTLQVMEQTGISYTAGST